MQVIHLLNRPILHDVQYRGIIHIGISDFSRSKYELFHGERNMKNVKKKFFKEKRRKVNKMCGCFACE